jgi:hypothetical protein
VEAHYKFVGKTDATSWLESSVGVLAVLRPICLESAQESPSLSLGSLRMSHDERDVEIGVPTLKQSADVM